MRLSAKDIKDLNLMKHYRVIRKWACKNNNLTDSDLELLIYLDCIDLFTIKDFKAGTYTAGSGQTTVDTGFGAPRGLIIKRKNQAGNWGWFQPDGWAVSNQEVRLNETDARDSSNFVHTGGYGFVPYGAYTTNTGIYCYMAFK